METKGGRTGYSSDPCVPQRGTRGAIFLLGDSSLDNKAYTPKLQPSINGYGAALRGRSPLMKPDVAYWINQALLDAGAGANWFCLNGACEESTIADRSGGRLLPQDAFVRNHLTAEDILVVSVGGNDVALKPSLLTVLNMAALLLQPASWLESGWCVGLGHFTALFKKGVEAYLRSVTAKAKPKLVVVCTIYFPDLAADGSWSDGVLGWLGYDRNPKKLQVLIRKIYAEAIARIELDGVPVVALPLVEVLDGTNPDDYVNRVEPSSQGGQKIACQLVFDSLVSNALASR